MDVELIIQNRTGLHARPAREFVNLAKTFQCDIRVQHAARTADGKSLVSLLTLAVKRGLAIRLEAHGTDEAAALAALTAAVRAGLGEEPGEGEAKAAPAQEPPVSIRETADDPRLRRGVAASPGLAVGPIHHLHASQSAVAPDAVVGSPAEERARLAAALAAARRELGEIRDRLVLRAGAAEAAIFDVHVEILEDPELVSAVLDWVEQGDPAARAWKTTLDGRAAALARLDDVLLAARAADLTDVAGRVLRLLGTGAALAPLPDHPVVIVAPDLSPSQTIAFDAGRVVGICTAAGGPTSHAVILARALGIPSVVGAGPRRAGVARGIDGRARRRGGHRAERTRFGRAVARRGRHRRAR